MAGLVQRTQVEAFEVAKGYDGRDGYAAGGYNVRYVRGISVESWIGEFGLDRLCSSLPGGVPSAG